MATRQRLDWDIERVFLKVDSENTGAVKLYKKLGYKEVARIAEELMVPKSPTSVSEWPVLNIYMQREMQRDMRPFPPLRSFAFNMSR
jgi:ribosomal protein S18 acetylase RimI-like enzyme